MNDNASTQGGVTADGYVLHRTLHCRISGCLHSVDVFRVQFYSQAGLSVLVVCGPAEFDAVRFGGSTHGVENQNGRSGGRSVRMYEGTVPKRDRGITVVG